MYSVFNISYRLIFLIYIGFLAKTQDVTDSERIFGVFFMTISSLVMLVHILYLLTSSLTVEYMNNLIGISKSTGMLYAYNSESELFGF
jgi:hypothetical protein